MSADACVMELKELSKAEIPAALQRAADYRQLGESAQAESVCHDILLADPDNQEALVLLLLALADRFGRGYAVDGIQAFEILPRIRDPYERAFYAGVICDHRANANLQDTENGCRYDAYEFLHEAMTCYGRAESLRPQGCAEARQRWNACARIINRNRLEPWPLEEAQLQAE